MNQWITNYVKGCATCQQNKILTYKRKTLLYQITTKEGTLSFQQVAMDLITSLPKHNGKDAILTIVDHECSRAAVFLPCTTTITGPGITQLYCTWTMFTSGLDSLSKSSVTETPTSHLTSVKALQSGLGSIRTCHPCSTHKRMEYQKERTNGSNNAYDW
jgi:hypothetical protein